MPIESNHKTALITGITGQDGSYLADLLLSKGYNVHGIVRRTSNLLRSRIEHLRQDPLICDLRFFLHYGDLQDATTLRRIFSRVEPDEFYHLAGQSHVGLSFEIPESTCEEVAMATIRLLEICRDQRKPLRVYHASSSEIFGAVSSWPQNEDTPFNPVNPYACAKAMATQMAKIYRESHGLYVCNGILYNHESPRRGENFVTRKISKTVAAIKRGESNKLILGNVEACRDWGHAKDYVEAIWQMLQCDQAGDYVVSSGVPHSVQDFIEAAFAVVDLPWEKHLEIRTELKRPAEPIHLVGDSTRIRERLGWSPKIDFNNLVMEMVKHDLEENRI